MPVRSRDGARLPLAAAVAQQPPAGGRARDAEEALDLYQRHVDAGGGGHGGLVPAGRLHDPDARHAARGQGSRRQGVGVGLHYDLRRTRLTSSFLS